MSNSNEYSHLPYPTTNFVFRCTHSYYHPNLGKLLTKGNLYLVKSVDPEHDIIQMTDKSNDAACCKDFFYSHFEEVYTSDSPEARKLYIDAVVNELIHKVDTTFYHTKCNCANEIIAKFAKEMQERWGDNR